MEKDSVRRIEKHNFISLDIFMRFLPLLATSSEKQIAHIVPNWFRLIIDGRPDGVTHFMGFFASFPAYDAAKFSCRLPCFSPLGEEKSQSAQ